MSVHVPVPITRPLGYVILSFGDDRSKSVHVGLRGDFLMELVGFRV